MGGNLVAEVAVRRRANGKVYAQLRADPTAHRRLDLAPLYVKRGVIPRLCECAPVLAAVKQSALDGGCGPALAGGGGNGAGNGSAGLLVRA